MLLKDNQGLMFTYLPPDSATVSDHHFETIVVAVNTFNTGYISLDASSSFVLDQISMEPYCHAPILKIYTAFLHLWKRSSSAWDGP